MEPVWNLIVVNLLAIIAYLQRLLVGNRELGCVLGTPMTHFNLPEHLTALLGRVEGLSRGEASSVVSQPVLALQWDLMAEVNKYVGSCNTAQGGNDGSAKVVIDLDAIEDAEAADAALLALQIVPTSAAGGPDASTGPTARPAPVNPVAAAMAPALTAAAPVAAASAAPPPAAPLVSPVPASSTDCP